VGVKFCKESAKEADMCCLHKTKKFVSLKFVSLKKKQDFKKVYSQGKYAADALFVAYALANDLDHNRIGITVSKKVGGAVVRNRVKRWVKESYRLVLLRSGTEICEHSQKKADGQAYDFIIVARKPVGELTGKGTFSKISNSVIGLMGRLGKKVGFSL